MKYLIFISILICLVIIAAYTILNPEVHELDEQERVRYGGYYIQLTDGVTHYRLEGPENGQLVVLVHGGTIPHWIWDEQTRVLADAGYRVLRYDTFGRGFSDRPDVNYSQALYQRQLQELIEGLGITDPFDLIGVSLGGGIASNFTAGHPDKVRKLILISPVVNGYKVPFIFRVPVFGELTARFFGRHLLIKRFKTLNQQNPRAEYYQKLFVQQTTYKGFQRSLLSMMRSNALNDYTPAYRAIAKQSREPLLIWGAADAEISKEMIDAVRSIIPDARFVPIEGAGHGVLAQEPEKINALLIEHLTLKQNK